MGGSKKRWCTSGTGQEKNSRTDLHAVSGKPVSVMGEWVRKDLKKRTEDSKMLGLCWQGRRRRSAFLKSRAICCANFQDSANKKRTQEEQFAEIKSSSLLQVDSYFLPVRVWRERLNGLIRRGRDRGANYDHVPVLTGEQTPFWAVASIPSSSQCRMSLQVQYESRDDVLLI